jgi:hypothetical protein
LFVDHFKVHLSGQFIQVVNDLGIDVDFVPAGYTCVLQPVDVGVNAQFKSAIRDFNHAWCLEKYPKILDQDKLPTPDRDDVYEWTTRSFDSVTSKTIRKTFLYIGLVEKDAFKDSKVDDENDQTDQAEEGGFNGSRFGGNEEVEVNLFAEEDLTDELQLLEM